MVGGSIILMQQMEIGFFASKEVLEDKPKEPEVLRVVTMEPLLIPILEENKVTLNLQLELHNLDADAGAHGPCSSAPTRSGR